MKDQVLEYSRKSVDDLFTLFHTNVSGLTVQNIASIQSQFGLNIIDENEVRWYHVLLRQFRSPFIYLLLGASGLSVVLNQFQDAFFILLFIVINTALGFYQEFKSEQTASLLKKFVESQVDVIRGNNKVQIASSELVPGDIVILSPGDRAQADMRIMESENLSVDESILTGESEAVHKDSEIVTRNIEQIYQASNLVFSGTAIVSGSAKAIVVATGKSKVFGKIAKIATETIRESSFEKGISSFSKFILKVVGITVILMLVANILIKGNSINFLELLLFAIALAVSVIPEALPVVTTFSLSQGAKRLAHKKVVVKRLSSIEDLGSISVLCTDKTGTITENKMRLVSHLAYKGGDVLLDAALSSDFAESLRLTHETNSFDEALFPSIGQDIKEKLKNVAHLRTLPFDPIRRRTTVLLQFGKKYSLVSRGAPENIMSLCGKIEQKDEILAWIKKEGLLGRRIMAIATREVKKDIDIAKSEKQMNLIGFLSYEDPLKETTARAMRKAKALGITIKILTGDRQEVAGAVAHAIGLIDNPLEVLTGEAFGEMTIEKKVQAVEQYSVFARVSPVQKYEIVQLLEQSHEVGFLGEGINDAPALKVANVGIVVQSASDISKDAADIILLKKSLLTIIEGIEEGRKVFANTVKYIRSTLTSNFGNFYAVAISSLLINFLPMLPIQILLVNLLTDFPMISIASDSVEETELRSPKSYQIREVATVATVLGIVSTAFDFLTFALFFKLAAPILQTNWFMESILTELVLIYSIRTRKPFFRSNMPAISIILLTIASALFTIILPYTNFGHKQFGFVSPSFNHLILIVGIVIVYFVATESAKLVLYRFAKRK